MRELCEQNRRLDFIKAGIHPCERANIFLFGAVIAQHTYHAGKFSVISNHRSPIAQRPQVFRGVKAVGCGSAKSFDFALRVPLRMTLVSGSMGLRRIFKHLQAMRICKFANGSHVR